MKKTSLKPSDINSESFLTFSIGQECGQKWYRLRSWTIGRVFRKWPGGFAVGPIMFFWRTDE